MGRLLLVSEVAERLRCSASSVYSNIARGRLKCYRVGAGNGGIRVTEEQIEAFLQSSETKPSATPPVREQAPPPAGGGGFTVLDADRLKEAWRGR
jgi:excisionase family DNA binding protein